MRWSERVKKRKASGGIGATVGIALLSGRNSIPAMRDTLSQLFDDYTNVATSIEGEVGGSHLADESPGEYATFSLTYSAHCRSLTLRRKL